MSSKTAGRPAGLRHGWPLMGVMATLILAATALVVLVTADPIEEVRRVIRLTARTSVVLFLLAFTASAAWRFWPNVWTRWQRSNRRYLGVSFAFSHGVHLVAILTLWRMAPAELADVTTITWIFGGLAYVFIAAMTLTSFDRTTRMVAQTFGPRAWTILHTTGSYYIWLIFANSYISRAVMIPEYIPAALLVVLALGLRIAARVAKTRAQPAAAASS
jgi:methionine sulfoxide reductase heme-binding subunit